MTPDLRSLLLLALLVALVLVIRRIPAARFTPLRGRGAGAWLPIAAGILAAATTLGQWGGFRAEPVIYDESAYLLQAGLLATGHWSRPSPPLPEAFTQSAVLVTPVLAPKMPPGHAIVLAIGVLLHLPGLIPVLLVGFAAAFLAILVRRAAGAGTAAIAVALWLTQAGQGRWRASYFSENTTTALWLFGWLALLRWRETGRGRWLVALAIATGWGAITRPLTMIAFAIPVAFVVIRDTIKVGRWRQFVGATVAGTAVLFIVPWQNHAITGAWNRTPLGVYTRQYVPWDRMGFGYDSTPPLLPSPDVFATYGTELVARHREHQPRALPRILHDRLRVGLVTNFAHWREFLLPVALLALLLLSRPLWFGFASAALLYLLYLVYAHEPSWSVYYAEATPVSAAVIAVGVGWLVGRALEAGPRAEAARVAVAIAILLWAVPDLVHWGQVSRRVQQPYHEFDAMLAAIPAPRALVFVRHAPGHDPNASLVRNVADPSRAKVLVAFDLGDTARALVRAGYPDRRPFLWDEATGRLVPDAP